MKFATYGIEGSIILIKETPIAKHDALIIIFPKFSNKSLTTHIHVITL
jgi:hypothetical protein